MIPATLAKSVESCAWALGSFGTQQLLRILPENWTAATGLRTQVYRSTEAAQQEFEQIAPLFFACQLGYQVEDTLADAAVHPLHLIDAGQSLARSVEDAARTLSSSQSRRLYLQQFRNNLAVVDFVNQSSAPVNLDPGGGYPLREEVRKCYAGDRPERDWPALWKVEGVGERFAAAHLRVNPSPVDLFTGGVGLSAPAEARLMLHSGMGIAFAKDVIRTITPFSSRTEFERALNRFIDLCRANSRKGCAGAALQSLGLVTRTWHRQMVEPISHHLLTIDPLVREFYWRAAGGAMYFSPLNWLPGCSPFLAAEREATDASALRNARAGVAWPFTIVNVRQPEIMENFLKERSHEIYDSEAWRSGVVSALVMAAESVPGHRYVESFAAWRPEEASVREAWDEYIGFDLMQRIDRRRRQHRLDEIFHCALISE